MMISPAPRTFSRVMTSPKTRPERAITATKLSAMNGYALLSGMPLIATIQVRDAPKAAAKADKTHMSLKSIAALSGAIGGMPLANSTPTLHFSTNWP